MEEKIVNLSNTNYFMGSDDYKDRFVAEYFQLYIRYNGLKKMIKKWDKDELKFTPTCPRSLYDEQLKAMKKYLTMLEARAAIENIDLDRYKEEIKNGKCN